MIKLSYMIIHRFIGVILQTEISRTCVKMKQKRLFVGNILPMYQMRNIFEIIDSFMNVQQSKEKKLSHTAFSLLFH
jgi:hypothetical protein